MKYRKVILTFELPLPPNLGNGRGHSRAVGRAKKKYFAQLDERQNCGLIPAPLGRFSPVTLAAELHVGARMDDDNAKFRAYKWPADWLKTRGYLVDDKRPHTTMLDPSQVVQRKGDRVVVITLTHESVEYADGE